LQKYYRDHPESSVYKNNGLGNHCFFDGHVELLTPRQLLPPSQGGNVGSERYHKPLLPGDQATW